MDIYYQNIIDRCNNSTFLNELETPNLKECCSSTFNQYFDQCTDDNVLGLMKFSPILHKFRANATGASKFTGKISSYYSFDENTAFAMLNGVKYEDEARQLYKENTKSNVIQCGKIIPPKQPWLIFEPDGLVLGKDNSIEKLLEIKNPKISEYIIRACNNNRLSPDSYYYDQIQFSLSILDLKSCDLVIYSTRENFFKIISVPRNDVYCTNMLNRLRYSFFTNTIPLLCKICTP